MSKESKILLGVIFFCAFAVIASVYIIVQGGTVAVQKSNASVFEVFNARENRIEAALASPTPAASARACLQTPWICVHCPLW